MKNICIYASELAVIIGINKYQKLSEMIIKLWQKNYPIDYENVTTNIKHKHDIKISPKETDIQCLKRIQDDVNIDLNDKVNNCLKMKDTKELLNERNKIMKEIEKNDNIDHQTKKEFQKSLENVTNKVFGTINEKSIIEYYTDKTNKKVICHTKFLRKDLCTYKDIKWSIGGKIDGITDDNIVIEVKNRIYKLFGTMRDYEKPQIQSYMYMLGVNKGHLVESLKKNGGIEINILEEDFDIQYWNDIILHRLNNFIKLFHIFLENVDLKTYVLLGDENEKEQILNSYIN